MQYKDIEIFLELVETRNITKASDRLFMAQSVISTRLKKLEEELGYELFVRNKGMREIDLTSQGAQFVALANRLQSLYEEAAMLKESTQKSLRIAAPESIYLSFLQKVIFSIRKGHPDIHIFAEMIDSSGVYEMMETNKIDYGFASYESAHHSIAHKHFYNQEFCLVAAQGNPKIVDPRTLNPEKEISFSGGNFSSIELWREAYLPQSGKSNMIFNSSLMIGQYINDFDGWSILPVEVAEMLAELYHVQICKLTDAPESRKIYFLSHNVGSLPQTEAGEIFLKELKQYEIN